MKTLLRLLRRGVAVRAVVILSAAPLLAAFFACLALSNYQHVLAESAARCTKEHTTGLEKDAIAFRWISELPSKDKRSCAGPVATLRDGSLIIACSNVMLSEEKGPSSAKEQCVDNIRAVNRQGAMQWEDNIFSEGITSIDCAHGSGDAVAICGFFNGAVTFAKGRSDERHLTSNGNWESFVACYSADGQLRFVSALTGLDANSPSRISSAAMNSDGEVLLTGSFFGTVRIPGENGFLELKHRYKRERIGLYGAPGGATCFAACLSPEGKAHWVKTEPVAAGSEGGGIAWVNKEALVVVGFYRGKLANPNSTPVPDSDERPNVVVEGDDNCFLAKYSRTGDLLWIQDVAKGSLALDPSVVVLRDGSAVVEVLACRRVALIGSGQEIHEEGHGNSDVVVAARYDSDGRCKWGKRITSPLNMFSFDNCGYAHLANSPNGFAVAGTFKGTLSVGDGVAARVLRRLGWGIKWETAFICEYDANGELLFAATPFAGRLTAVEMATGATENVFYFCGSAESDVKLYGGAKWPGKSHFQRASATFLAAVERR